MLGEQTRDTDYGGPEKESGLLDLLDVLVSSFEKDIVNILRTTKALIRLRRSSGLSEHWMASLAISLEVSFSKYKGTTKITH